MESEIIVISDDDEETSYRSSEVPVIYIPDDDKIDDFIEFIPPCETPEVEFVESQNGGEACSPLSASVSASKPASSPRKNFKISDSRIKMLKAKVRLSKLAPEVLKQAKVLSPKKVEDRGKPCSDQTCQVKVENDTSRVNSCEQPRNAEVGLFELVERKFSPLRPETSNGVSTSIEKTINSHVMNNLSFQSPSKKKRSDQSLPSSPLKQSTLNAESFSPKRRPPESLYPKQEQPHPFIAPLYCAATLRTLEHSASTSRPFTQNQLNSIQALKEEHFHKLVLDTVLSFMNQDRRPPPSLVFYLLQDMLLSSQSNLGPECFRVLRQIQVLHPAVPTQMIGQKITWEYLSMVVKLSRCTNNTNLDASETGTALNASMALAFIFSVMEEEVQRKKFSIVKTSAYRLLCAVKQSSHVRDVIQWIEKSVQQHVSSKSTCGYNSCPLFILQRFLQLSLLVSERPEDSAVRIADELVLVYLVMGSLHHKTLLLQSVQSHLLKTKLIELIVSNCCPANVEQENPGRSRGGLRHVVYSQFQRSPPTNLTFAQDCSTSALPDGCENTANVETCEEFVMLMAYWLQSFLFCRKRTLQKNTSDSLPELSIDGVDVLTELDEPVSTLRDRLESLCNPLSPRTYQLLDLMLSMKSFAALY